MNKLMAGFVVIICAIFGASVASSNYLMEVYHYQQEDYSSHDG